MTAHRGILIPVTRMIGARQRRPAFLPVWLAAYSLAIAIPFHLPPLHASSPSSAAATTLNSADIAERNRLMEQELRLAARPQTYLVLDLQTGHLLIKARGLELYRLALSSWVTPEFDRLASPFSLKARPPIPRTKSGPPGDSAAKPIELSDMPNTFDLSFDPPLVVSVEASTHRSAWVRLRSRMVAWWHSLTRVSRSFTETNRSTDDVQPPMLSLSLAEEDAQSLAWTAMDGMPLLILRKSRP